MRVLLLAQNRMDSIGAYQQIRFHADNGTCVRDEARRDRSAACHGNEAMAGVDVRIAQSLPCCREQLHLQYTAMNGNLRYGISGKPAARFAPDALAMPVEVHQFACRNAERFQTGAQAHPVQYLDGVRQQVDADSEGAQGWCGLVEVHFVPDFGQLQGGDAPPDAGAGDTDFH
jgi:hypothetical protein